MLIQIKSINFGVKYDKTLNKMIIVINNNTDLAYAFKEKQQAGDFIGVSRNTIHNNSHKTKHVIREWTIYYPQNKLEKSKRGGKYSTFGAK